MISVTYLRDYLYFNELCNQARENTEMMLYFRKVQQGDCINDKVLAELVNEVSTFCQEKKLTVQESQTNLHRSDIHGTESLLEIAIQCKHSYKNL